MLKFHLSSATFQCIAVIGTPDSCKSYVFDELDTLQLTYEKLDVPSMASLEDIHRHQRENTIIREGYADRPTFIRSFLATNGFQQMPKVLVLSGFNCVPSKQTYFLKALLDQQTREDDECYNQLSAIVLIIVPVDAPEAFDIDPGILGCVSAIVNAGE